VFRIQGGRPFAAESGVAVPNLFSLGPGVLAGFRPKWPDLNFTVAGFTPAPHEKRRSLMTKLLTAPENPARG
jgi:hypothetical protein